MGAGWKRDGKMDVAAKKGALFTKLTREIAVSAKLGGPDPDCNTRLKLAINAAKAVSCPRDTIERAIKKGSGQLEGQTIEELTYEGYGPHGIGIIVECQTDNKIRTVNELRLVFRSNSGTLGEPGAVAWMFERVAMIEGHKENVGDPEEDAIEVGANEVLKGANDNYTFFGAPAYLDQIRTALLGRGWTINLAELSFKAKEPMGLDEPKRKEVIALLEAIDDFDDSHRVHATLG